MSTTLADLAAALQILFTTDAEDIARSTAFVRRARKLTGPTFAQGTVFGWLQDPTAKRCKSMSDRMALLEVLVALQRRLRQLAGQQRRRSQPAAFQLAENPFDLEFNYMPAA